MAEKLTKYLSQLVEKADGLVVVEAGHFYAEEGVDDQVLAGVQVAANLLQLMVDFFSLKPDQMLLVDDIGEKIEPFMIQAAIANLIQFGFEPEYVIYESQLVNKGKEVIESLKQKGLAKDHQGRARLKQGWIPLQGKAGIADYPACEVLDTVLYQQKLSQWAGAVTILPHGYQEQQQKTKKVLQALSNIQKPNVLVVYHNKSAEVTDIGYWGQHENS